jgi:exopolyphosphatase/guanosine-5'-triphosphate,3'-diphosphate pyrophosphatase
MVERATVRVAAIDCGTNSIRLLIADIDGTNFREVIRLMEVVRLGQGVDKTGEFHPDAIARTLAAVDIYAAEIAKRGVEKIRFCATSATRDATNRDLFIEGVFERLGIRPEVISGDEEARLSFMGATKDLPASDGPFLVIDIGGGSTEIIWLAKTPEGPKARLTASVPVGVVSLAESYGAHAASREGFDRMRADLQERFAPFAREMGGGFDVRRNHLLGTSGTVTTLAAIALKLPRYNRTRVDGSWHETRHMLNVVERLVGMDTQALSGIGSIGTERADLMLPGCAIFSAICSLWPSPVLRVADRGLREGMLRQLSQELS